MFRLLRSALFASILPILVYFGVGLTEFSTSPWLAKFGFAFLILVLLGARPNQNIQLTTASQLAFCGSFLVVASLPLMQSAPILMAGMMLGVLILIAKRSDSVVRSTVPLCLAAALCGLVVRVSGNEGSADPLRDFLMSLGVSDVETAVFLIRKSIHVLFYGTIGLLLALSSLTVRHSGKVMWGLTLATVGVAGLTDEYLQMFATSRTSQFSDVLFDLLGAVLSLLLANSMKRKHRSSESP